MDKAEFNKLSTFEQQQMRVSVRNGRTNLQCLKDIFGERVVPFTATAFHTSKGQAVFLDTSSRNPDWFKPVAEVPLTPELAHQLDMVGMIGSLGWTLREGGGIGSVVDLASKTINA